MFLNFLLPLSSIISMPNVSSLDLDWLDDIESLTLDGDLTTWLGLVCDSVLPAVLPPYGIGVAISVDS